MTWRWALDGLEGSLVPKQSLWLRRVTDPTAFPIVVFGLASNMQVLMSGSGALTCLCTLFFFFW